MNYFSREEYSPLISPLPVNDVHERNDFGSIYRTHVIPFGKHNIVYTVLDDRKIG